MKNLYTKILSVVMAQKAVVIGVAVVALIVFGGGLWSSGNGKYETLTIKKGAFVQTVSVSGKVQAENEVDLSFSQSGRISRIYVNEGQPVYPGTLIAEIENGDLYATLLQREAALEREEAKLDALLRGSREEELAVYESSVSSARASVTAANQAVVDAIYSAFSTADGAIHASVDQFFSNPNTTSPQLSFLTGDSALKSSVESGRYSIGTMLKDWELRIANVGATSDLVASALDAQVSLQKVSTYLGSVSNVLAAAIPTTGVTQTTLDSYKTDIAGERASINTVTSALTTAVKAQTAAQTALVTAERDLALKRAGTSAEDLRAQEATVKAAEADVLSAAAQLQKTQIRSPFPGTVTKIDARVGKSVSPSEAQVSVIGSGLYQLESFVPEINVSLLAVGDKAVVTFDSYGAEVTFEAVVLTIDLGETEKDGVSTYRTMLAFTKADPRIRSGMTANVAIIADEREGVIAVPQRLVRSFNGAKVVSVLEDETVVDRTVTVGAVSFEGNLEILSGLSEGDVVVVK